MSNKYFIGQQGVGHAKNWKIALVYIFLVTLALVFLFPLIWMILTTFKTPDQTFNHKEIFWPTPWTMENVIKVFSETPLMLFVKNSVIVTFFSIIGAVISSTLAGFAFGRLKFRFRNSLFLLVLLGMMIPSQATMIPRYLIFQKLRMIDTLIPLILPSWLAASVQGAFYIFIVRQFVMSIPKDIDEAAKIDGCGYFKIYSKIIMPLLVPAIGSILIFSFLENWGNFLDALIYLNSESNFTLPIGIQYFQTQDFVDWNKIMCASLVSAVPAIVLLFSGQKYLIKGVNLSASKG